jgi:cbb3-type cytochrome oxidase maturation protein
MSVIYIVVPLALLVVGAAVAAFVWAANRGQFDDLETPAVRMLHDDDERGPAGAPGDSLPRPLAGPTESQEFPDRTRRGQT